MTSEEQEALSRKYIGETISIIPLQSGRFALFSAIRADRDLRLIGTMDEIGAFLSARFSDRLAANQKADIRVAEYNQRSRALDGLGDLLGELKL